MGGAGGVGGLRRGSEWRGDGWGREAREYHDGEGILDARNQRGLGRAEAHL